MVKTVGNTVLGIMLRQKVRIRIPKLNIHHKLLNNGPIQSELNLISLNEDLQRKHH